MSLDKIARNQQRANRMMLEQWKSGLLSQRISPKGPWHDLAPYVFEPNFFAGLLDQPIGRMKGARPADETDRFRLKYETNGNFTDETPPRGPSFDLL